MNKEQMKARLNDLEEQISYMTVQAAKLAAFIKSPEFRGLPDIEATLVIQQNHLIAAYYRTLTLQAALLSLALNLQLQTLSRKSLKKALKAIWLVRD